MFCLSFPSRDRATAPGRCESRVAIPNTTKEVRNQIMLDPEIPINHSFVYGDGGGGRISFCLVVEHLQGRKLNRDLEFCGVGSSCNVGRWGLR
jgi:hypothetical protein